MDQNIEEKITFSLNKVNYYQIISRQPGSTLSLGPPTRKKPPNFEVKIEIYFFLIEIQEKNQFYIFPLLIRSPKELSNARDNTTLNTQGLQICFTNHKR